MQHRESTDTRFLMWEKPSDHRLPQHLCCRQRNPYWIRPHWWNTWTTQARTGGAGNLSPTIILKYDVSNKKRNRKFTWLLIKILARNNISPVGRIIYYFPCVPLLNIPQVVPLWKNHENDFKIPTIHPKIPHKKTHRTTKEAARTLPCFFPHPICWSRVFFFL